MTGEVVLFVFLFIEIIVGALLNRSKKPYNVAVLIVHIVFSLFIITGLASGIYVCIKGIDTGKMLAAISLYAAGVALLLNLITGLRLSGLKADNPKIVAIHKVTAFTTAALLIARIIFDIVKI